jgi:hypothetical protein
MFNCIQIEHTMATEKALAMKRVEDAKKKLDEATIEYDNATAELRSFERLTDQNQQLQYNQAGQPAGNGFYGLTDC